jgi:hypothetical protein
MVSTGLVPVTHETDATRRWPLGDVQAVSCLQPAGGRPETTKMLIN